MIILVCGDRHWDDDGMIDDVLRKYPRGTKLITGGARGADQMANRLGTNLGLDCFVVNAKWHIYGKGAGPKRNKEMLDMSPDVILAFHNDLSKSKGTKDTIEQAKKMGIKVILYSHKDPNGMVISSGVPTTTK